jgi:hypothetical protein
LIREVAETVNVTVEPASPAWATRHSMADDSDPEVALVPIWVHPAGKVAVCAFDQANQAMRPSPTCTVAGIVTPTDSRLPPADAEARNAMGAATAVVPVAETARVRDADADALSGGAVRLRLRSSTAALPSC